MTNETSENNKVTAESEISSNGVGHSKMLNEAGEAKASSAELTKVLKAQQDTIMRLEAELKSMKADKASDSSLDKLANAIIAASNKANTPVVGPTEADNLNRTSNFKERATIDGNSLMEAQATMLQYKNEKKEPISIPKTFQNQFGPTLAITVNGVRVAIPCDGKTYFINHTHAVHARERIAKVDKLLSNTEPEIIEING